MTIDTLRLKTCLLALLLFPACAAIAQSTLRLEDIVEQAEPQSPRISPDGRMVAFLVRQASISGNAYKTSLYIAASGAQPRKLLEEASISQLDWIPDNSALTAMLPRGGNAALWRIPLDAAGPQPLFEHPTRVSLSQWSPDATRLVFVSSEVLSAEERLEVDNRGTVFDDTVFGIRNFTNRSWNRPKPPQLWIWNTRTRKAERIAIDLSAIAGFQRLVWSPNSSKIAIEYSPKSGSELGVNVSHIGIIDLEKSTFQAVITWSGANRGADWSSDSQSLAFASMGDIQPRVRFYENRLNPHIWKPDGRGPQSVKIPSALRFLSTAWWDATGKRLLFEYENRSRSTLYRVPISGGGPEDVLGGTEHFSGFHFNRDRTKAACIVQTFTRPPEIALVDLATGKHQVLTQLNTGFKEIRLAEGKELQWKNRFGYPTNGFLMRPQHPPNGSKLPLLIIFYHFSNKFTTQAQWITSYPAQPFVDAGFAVLLMNYPYELGWHYGDFHAAALSQAYNPLASIEKAVQMLVADGTADPRRIGIMGWSFGAWLTEFAISHTRLFHAASAGEGGLNNAGQYWVTGSATMRYYLDAFFGGPPLGATYRNYQEVAPALNAHRIDTPLLREYGPDVGVQSLELYAMMRRLGKPVEQIVYPNAPHVLDLPSQRLASMQRNLDWFRFWLQGYEDPNPSKSAQYLRWKDLTQLRAAK